MGESQSSPERVGCRPGSEGAKLKVVSLLAIPPLIPPHPQGWGVTYTGLGSNIQLNGGEMDYI